MQRILILFILVMATLASKAQTQELAGGLCMRTAERPDFVYRITDQLPQLLLRTGNSLDAEQHKTDAQQQMLGFLYRHLRFPAGDYGCVSGTVVIGFVIGSDGLIDQESLRCVREIGPGFGEEAKRVVQLMADLGWRWAPARQDGLAMPFQYYLPLKFHLI